MRKFFDDRNMHRKITKTLDRWNFPHFMEEFLNEYLLQYRYVDIGIIELE